MLAVQMLSRSLLPVAGTAGLATFRRKIENIMLAV